jgi:hypothetical protein
MAVYPLSPGGLRLPTHVELASRAHVVPPANWLAVGSLLQLSRLLVRFVLDGLHSLDELIQGLLGLGLGGLDKQTLGHQQRKVGGRRMMAVVQKPLGHVHRRHTGAFLELLEGDDEVVHGSTTRIRGIEAGIHQTLHQIVGIQRGEVGNPADALLPQQAQVDIRAKQHADIAGVGRQAPDGLRVVLFSEPTIFPVLAVDHRQGQKRLELFVGAHRARLRRGAWRRFRADSCA